MRISATLILVFLVGFLIKIDTLLYQSYNLLNFFIRLSPGPRELV